MSMVLLLEMGYGTGLHAGFGLAPSLSMGKKYRGLPSRAAQLLDLIFEIADALGELEDDLHPGEIDAQVLDEPSYLLGAANVVDRIQSNSTLGARGGEQTLPLVRSQRLGVHAQHARGDADGEVPR